VRLKDGGHFPNRYVELHHEPEPGYVGLIDRHTYPAEVIDQAAGDAKYMCERAHGDAPDVVIQGRKDLSFSCASRSRWTDDLGEVYL
jgi:hypothetical protein